MIFLVLYDIDSAELLPEGIRITPFITAVGPDENEVWDKIRDSAVISEGYHRWEVVTPELQVLGGVATVTIDLVFPNAEIATDFLIAVDQGARTLGVIPQQATTAQNRCRVDMVLLPEKVSQLYEYLYTPISQCLDKYLKSF